MINALVIFKMYKYDWINIVLISIFALIALINLQYHKRFTSLIFDFFNNKYFTTYSKNIPVITNAFNTFFLPINLLTFGLIAFYFAEQYLPDLFSTYDIYAYLIITSILSIYFIIKSVLSLMFSFLFVNIKKSKDFLFYKVAFRNLSAIISLPFIIFHQYSTFDHSTTIIVLLSVFAIFHTISYLFSSIQLVVKNKYQPLHYFLYLCTLEIAPIVIYIKLVLIMISGGF